MAKCADPECSKPATRELRGIPMCEAYYIEALEHCAHLDFGQWDGKEPSIYDERKTWWQLAQPEAPAPNE